MSCSRKLQFIELSGVADLGYSLGRVILKLILEIAQKLQKWSHSDVRVNKFIDKF